jgi:hypothetical protein
MITVSFAKSCEIWLASRADEKDYNSRPTLSGVQIKPSGLMIATNCHIAAIIGCQIEDAPADWSGAIVPASFIQEAAKNARGMVTFTLDPKTETVTAPHKKAGQWADRLIPGIFPNVERILKSAHQDKGKEKVQCVGLDPWLMARLALAIGCTKNTPIWHEWAGGEKPVLVYGPEERSIGLLMPGNCRLAREEGDKAYAQMSALLADLNPKQKVAA